MAIALGLSAGAVVATAAIGVPLVDNRTIGEELAKRGLK